MDGGVNTVAHPSLSMVLTDGAGHEVDPGRLHLNVEPMAVRHEQPCGERTRNGDPWKRTGRYASARLAAITAISWMAMLPAQDGAVA